MAGGPEDHFTDSRELYVLVEGDEWAHVEALDPDAGYWARRFAQLVNWRARSEKAVIEPSSLQRRNSQLKEIAKLDDSLAGAIPKRALQDARRTAAPRGANCWVRVSMCQIAWVSRRAMSTGGDSTLASGAVFRRPQVRRVHE
jgi:hypothetical protein